MLTGIFQEDNFEGVLTANWTRFMDSGKLLAYVLRNVQEHANRLAIISGTKVKAKGVSMTISRFYLNNNGFGIWLEFSVPVGQNKTAEGTMELSLDLKGNLNHVQTIGNVYVP